jgi:hypothetical protein
MLTDIGSKMPITDAVILCNGKQNPYIRKDEGYYIFADLCPGHYKIEIFCSGYVNTDLECELKAGQSHSFVFDLPYNSVNPSLVGTPRFEFLVKKDGKSIKNKNILVILKNPVKLLKVIQKAKQGDQMIFLNINDDPLLFPQRYIFTHKGKDEKKELENKPEQNDNKKNEENGLNDENSGNTENKNRKNIKQKIFIVGFDKDSGTYALHKPIKESMPIGGSFMPYWELKTDHKGKVILPLMGRFIKDSKVNFELQLDDEKKHLTADFSNFDNVYKTLQINAEF